MLKKRRLPGAAALLSLAFAGTAASAQDTNTVGPPQLKDFSLPGQRTTAPPPVQTPAPAPAPTANTAAPEPTRPVPAPARPRPAPTRSAPTPAPAARTPAPARIAPRPMPAQAAPPTTAAPAPPPAPVQAAPTPAPVPAGPPPVQAPQPQTAPVTAQPVSGAFPWLWLLAALVVAGAAAAFMLRRRRSLEDEDVRDRGALAGSLAAAPEPEPEPEPDIAPPAPEPVPEPAKRPWLDVDLRPERTEALEDGAFVHYALTLTNRGDAPAGNIRIDGRMFNAGADGAVEAFFAAPLHPVSGSPHVAIPPGEAITLHGQVGMPRAEMQAIDVQGRAIFVPLVAVNVGYDWDGGAGGKTSRSWLVGREASTPEARMGAFRLDLGPRIYRQVDRREAKKALA